MAEKYIWGGGTDAPDPITNEKLNSMTEYAEELAATGNAFGAQFAIDNETTTGLVFGYNAGAFRDDNVVTPIAAGTVALTDNATNYVEVNATGVLVNTTGFTSGRVPLYEITIASGAVSNIEDKRAIAALGGAGGGSDLELGETSTTAYRGDRGKTAYDHSQLTIGNPHNVTKGDVGLGNVSNDAQITVAQLDTDSTLTANSDSKIPSQKAIRTYVDAKISEVDGGGDGGGAVTNKINSVLRNHLLSNSWLNSTAAQANSWRDVCWSPELGLFCAISSNDASSGTNYIMTSPDGVNWTSRSIPGANGWYAVCWSSELSLFCATTITVVGNTVATSPDGVNWTLQSASSGSSQAWKSICWSPELNLFCAVADSSANRIMTSPDGVNWSVITEPETNSWNSICWSGELGLYCAVSRDGTNRVMTSPDGVNWTSRTAPEANSWYSICWSGELGLFCAVSSNGTNRVMTSPDGANWTSCAAAEASTWVSVCWSAELGLFCAVASNGTNRVMVSPDGENWTILTVTEASVWIRVCWSAELGLFCAVANNGTNRVMTSVSAYSYPYRAPA